MTRPAAVPVSRRSWCVIAVATLLTGLGHHTAFAQATETRETPAVYTAEDRTKWRDMLRVESARWQLTEAEYARYLELMQGPRGSLSVPTISPLEVLGIHAETPADREKFAARWVDMLKADTARVLAFQNAVNQVWQTQHADEPMINRARVNQLRAASDSRFGPLKLGPAETRMSLVGRTLFFTRPDCGACDSELEVALDLLDAGQIAGLDIYLGGVTHGDDATIRKWARARRLPIARLADRTITLNYDVGVSTTVAHKLGRSPSMPMAVQRRGAAYEVLALTQY